MNDFRQEETVNPGSRTPRTTRAMNGTEAEGDDAIQASRRSETKPGVLPGIETSCSPFVCLPLPLPSTYLARSKMLKKAPKETSVITCRVGGWENGYPMQAAAETGLIYYGLEGK